MTYGVKSATGWTNDCALRRLELKETGFKIAMRLWDWCLVLLNPSLESSSYKAA